MNNIQETLFRTIDTIAESKLNKIKFDKTIGATIVSDEKANVGEYELRYQDIIFVAYSATNTMKYSKGETVLVLIPDGDMSNRKTIVSSNKSKGEIYVDVENVIDRVGINLIDEPKDFEIGLSTTSDEEVSFKIKKQTMIDLYPGKRFLSIGADIYTNISEKDIDGVYGIAIDCIFTSERGERIPHTFEFNTLNVTGNPFQSRGYKEVQIPLLQERLVEVVGARAFSKGFSAGNEKIKFKNIVIEYVNFKDGDKSKFSGNISTPKGTHFRNNSLYPDEKLDLIMEFKQNGSILDTDAISYKWFVMNGEVNGTEHPGYNAAGGIGWEYLKDNKYKDSLEGVGTKALSVSAKFVPTFSTFKCVASYDKMEVSVVELVTLVDHTEEMHVEIKSSNGVSFVNGEGETTLTCSITQSGEPLEMELDYEWTRVKNSGEVEIVKKGNYPSIEVKAKDLDTKSVYTCEVSLKESTRPFATGYITLVNIVDGNTQGVLILGGFRSVLYDADGRAPKNLNKEGFQFDVYSNGEKVTEGLQWTWKIPAKEHTLLTLADAVLEEGGKQTSKHRVLNLGVENKFNYDKNQNTIELEVSYVKNGIRNILREYVNISVTKVGTNGADGAAGQQGNDGKTYIYEIQGGTPTVTYDKNGVNPKPSSLPPFRLMFSVDGDMALANEVDSVEWSIQAERESVLGFEGLPKSRRTLTTRKSSQVGAQNPHEIKIVVDPTYSSDKYNNFIKATISYKGHKFIETYPISVIKNGSDGEMGLTITTNPNSYNIEAEADGSIKESMSLLLNFSIHRSYNKIENYRISSVGGAPRGMEYEIEDKTLRLTFLSGRELPDNGVLDIELEIEGSSYKQSFSFSKTRNGESPYLLMLQSTNGLVFKRGDVSTVIYAIVMKGAETITEKIPANAFEWEKIDKNGQAVRGWSPRFLDDKRDKIIITPDDILERATFNCSLNL